MANNCGRCGAKLSFFERFGEPVCAKCKRELAAEKASARKQFGDTIAAVESGSLSIDDAKQTLTALVRTAAYDPKELAKIHGVALTKIVDRLLADEVLSPDEEREFTETLNAFGLTNADLNSLNKALVIKVVIAKANAGRLDRLPGNEIKIMPKKNEDVYLETPANLMKEVTHREYVGGYSGVSFRIVKGVRFHTGGVRGHSVVTGTTIDVADAGKLALTSARAVFLGQRKTVEIPLTKLVGVDVYTDAIRFHASNRQNAPLFKVPSGELAAAIVNAAAQKLDI